MGGNDDDCVIEIYYDIIRATAAEKVLFNGEIKFCYFRNENNENNQHE